MLKRHELSGVITVLYARG